MILLLDNHDSFVHNLARYIRLAGESTLVIRSDAIDAAGCRALNPTAIVLSPGPHRPENAGCCVEVVRRLATELPILGVCLGHQAIGYAFGAEVVRSEPMHGRASELEHDGQGLFDGCPNPLRVGRYHSLAIAAATLPSELCVTASTREAEGRPATIMAIRHRTLPVCGVQFHPESVLTDAGDRLIGNFVAWACQRRKSAPLTNQIDDQGGGQSAQQVAGPLRAAESTVEQPLGPPPSQPQLVP